MIGGLRPIFISYNFIPLIFFPFVIQTVLWQTEQNYANYWQLLIPCMFLIVHCYSPPLFILFTTNYNFLIGKKKKKKFQKQLPFGE